MNPNPEFLKYLLLCPQCALNVHSLLTILIILGIGGNATLKFVGLPFVNSYKSIRYNYTLQVAHRPMNF
jgi:hypothetical protein